MSSSNFIEIILPVPEQEVDGAAAGGGDGGTVSVFEEELIKVQIPITGGKYANKVPPLPKDQYETLRESIAVNGLWEDITINRQGDVLDGHHRLKACLELGIEPRFEVKPFQNELEEELFVYDVNLARRQLTKFQRVELALQKQPLLAEQARRNMEAGKTLSQQQERVHVDEKIAQDSDSSKDTVYKVKKITNSDYFKENEEFREKVRTEKIRVEHAYSQVIRAEDRDKPKPKPPAGQYEVLLIDPPWDYDIPGRGTPENHYSVMTDDEILALHIPAAENAVMFLWATYPKLDIAMETMKAWGFEYKSGMVWIKDRVGTGYIFRGQHEHLLYGRKGSGLGTPAEADRHPSVLFAPRGEHSEKPKEVYDIIESMYPGRSYIEMFARGIPRDGWNAWGLETTHQILEPVVSEEEETEDPDLARFRKFGRPAFQNDKPRKENHWLFNRIDPRLGQKHPGQIPGQIAMNILYYYTKEGDLVVDPMAGGGSTIDACKVMERRYLAYDINPLRPDINKWDITQGFPKEAQSCDMIYLDPPYWNMMDHLYSKEGVSSLSLQEFMKAMRKLAEDSYKTLKDDEGGGGHVALVMMPFHDIKGGTDKFIDMSFMCTQEFLSAGFEEVQRVAVPLSFQTKSVFDVVNINMKRGLLLDTNRDLIVFAKKKKKEIHQFDD